MSDEILLHCRFQPAIRGSCYIQGTLVVFMENRAGFKLIRYQFKEIKSGVPSVSK